MSLRCGCKMAEHMNSIAQPFSSDQFYKVLKSQLKVKVKARQKEQSQKIIKKENEDRDKIKFREGLKLIFKCVLRKLKLFMLHSATEVSLTKYVAINSLSHRR